MHKIKTFFICLLFLFSVGLSAQSITRIAVLDYSKLLNYFQKDSLQVKRFEEEKQIFKDKLAEWNDKITSISLKVDEAIADGNKTSEQRYKRELERNKTARINYAKLSLEKIKAMQNKLAKSVPLSQDIQDAIEMVARDGGYSIILRKSNNDIIWSVSDIDITQAVISRVEKLSD